MAEQRTLNPQVLGSNPRGRTTTKVVRLQPGKSNKPHPFVEVDQQIDIAKFRVVASGDASEHSDVLSAATRRRFDDRSTSASQESVRKAERPARCRHDVEDELMARGIDEPSERLDPGLTTP